MQTITVTKPFKFAERGIDVIEYAKGTHAVSDRCAEVALEEKWANPATGGATTQRPEGDALMAAIAAAADGLDPDDDFTKDGKPEVKALEHELGYDISAAERDAAWDSVSGGPA